MISKEKWAETKLSWQRYGGEYMAIIFFVLLFLTVIWFFVICPIVNYFHENEISSIKTELLRKIEDNSATLEFSNENEAKKAELNLGEISKKDDIHFKDIKLSRKGEKFEIKVYFKSAK